MLSGDVVFPSSYALVIKKIRDFDAEKGEVNLASTLIMRIKVEQAEHHEDEAIMDHLQTNLRMRINEVEKHVIDDLGAKVVLTSS